MNAAARKVGRWSLYLIGGILALVLLVLITSWIGSSIPRGEESEAPIANPVTIMVETNGMHTQLVLPIAHPYKDWRETFPSANEWVSDAAYGAIDGPVPATHVAIGFGEREVFLNTPTLSDLKIGTAARVTVFGGEGLIRVSNLVNPPLYRNRRKLEISSDQYAALVDAILADLPPLDGQVYREYEYGSYDEDAYYVSSRGYTVGTTCNQWTSDRLADASIRTGWWTPFSGGVMKWLPPYRTELGPS
ncbi:MAG: DUF2459 domain-containing protein [Pseudomonadota bacterium]